MDRRGATIVGVGVLVAVLFAAIATAGPVGYVDGPPQFGEQTPAPIPPRDLDETPETSVPPLVEQRHGVTFELPWIVETIFNALFAAAIVVATVLLLRAAWRNRPRLRWRRRRSAEFAPLPDLDEAVAAIEADAAAQRAALRSGTPRNAIVECWLRLEGSVEAAGFRRDPSETSTELTERVLARSSVDPVALARLAALYREARFSQHTIDEAKRQEAIDALDAVHATLAGRPAADVAEATGVAEVPG